MDVGSLIGLAAVTRGELEIEEAGPQNLRMTGIGFGKLGIRWDTDGRSIRVPSDQRLAVVPDLGGSIPKIDDAPWPGFPADLVSPDVRAGMAMLIAAFCAQGRSTIQNVYQIERGYENLTQRLQALGARIKRSG